MVAARITGWIFGLAAATFTLPAVIGWLVASRLTLDHINHLRGPRA